MHKKHFTKFYIEFWKYSQQITNNEKLPHSSKSIYEKPTAGMLASSFCGETLNLFPVIPRTRQECLFSPHLLIKLCNEARSRNKSLKNFCETVIIHRLNNNGQMKHYRIYNPHSPKRDGFTSKFSNILKV